MIGFTPLIQRNEEHLAEKSRATWNLKLTLVGIVFLFVLLVVFDDPEGLVHPLLITSIFLFSTFFVFSKIIHTERRKKLLAISIVFLLPLLMFFASYSATGNSGLPSPMYSTSIQQNCQNVQIPNSTSPTGFTNGTRCTQGSILSSLNPFSVFIDYIYWIPITALVIFAAPVWKRDDSLSDKASRNILGAAFAAFLLLPIVGLNVGEYYPPHVSGWAPLNPYFAFAGSGSGSCMGSMNSFVGCVSVNPVYLVIDFLFWLAIASLIALLSSELITSVARLSLRTEKGRESRPYSTKAIISGG